MTLGDAGREAHWLTPCQVHLAISLKPCSEQVLPQEQALGSLQPENSLTSAVGRELSKTPSEGRKGSQVAPCTGHQSHSKGNTRAVSQALWLPVSLVQ